MVISVVSFCPKERKKSRALINGREMPLFLFNCREKIERIVLSLSVTYTSFFFQTKMVKEKR